MTAYLEAVRIAADQRAQAQADAQHVEHTFRAAIRRAAEHHSLREVGRAAGITHAGVRYIIQQKGNTP